MIVEITVYGNPLEFTFDSLYCNESTLFKLTTGAEHIPALVALEKERGQSLYPSIFKETNTLENVLAWEISLDDLLMFVMESSPATKLLNYPILPAKPKPIAEQISLHTIVQK